MSITIVAISGHLGSGKTSLAAALAASLPRCEVINEDHWHDTAGRSTAQMRQWLDAGGDLTDFDLSAVVEQLALKRQRLQQASWPGEPAAETPGLIVLESQFGRAHPSLAPLIDVQYWIDVPRDIAVVRKFAQWCQQLQMQPPEMTVAQRWAWLGGFCDGYLEVVSDLLVMQRQRVMPLSDLVVDGTHSVATSLAKIHHHQSRPRLASSITEP